MDEAASGAMIARGEFLEWAAGARQPVRHVEGGDRGALPAAHDVVLEIDWQGALQIKPLFPHAVLIFILPPSWDELERRLRGRGEDRPEVIGARMRNAREEVAQARQFDFVIIKAVRVGAFRPQDDRALRSGSSTPPSRQPGCGPRLLCVAAELGPDDLFDRNIPWPASPSKTA